MGKDKKAERLKEQLNTARKAIKVLEGEVKSMERVFDCTINELEGEDKCKVVELKALTNRAMELAKNGGDYNTVLEQIKAKFKTNS